MGNALNDPGNSPLLKLGALVFSRDPAQAMAGYQTLSDHAQGQRDSQSQDWASRLLLGAGTTPTAQPNFQSIPKTAEGLPDLMGIKPPPAAKASPMMDSLNMNSLMNTAVGPQERLKAFLEQQAAAKKPIGKLGANEVYLGPAGEEIAANRIAPEGFKTGATREFQRGNQKVTQEYDGKSWRDIASGDAFAPREPKEVKPKTIGDIFKERIGVDVPSGYKPVVGADGIPTGDVAPLGGGPAAIGQKGLPQAYKQQTAALDTLESTVKQLRDRFAQTGTELFNTEKAGDLDSLHTQFLLGVKNAEQLGALDKGAIDVADRLIRTPTGIGASLTSNSYITKQIDNYLDQIGRKRADLKKAFSANESSVPPGTVVDGYRYKGGDPNNEASWEAIN